MQSKDHSWSVYCVCKHPHRHQVNTPHGLWVILAPSHPNTPPPTTTVRCGQFIDMQLRHSHSSMGWKSKMHSDDVMRKKREHSPVQAVVENHLKILVKRCMENRQVSRRRCRWVEMRWRKMEEKKMERRGVMIKEWGLHWYQSRSHDQSPGNGAVILVSSSDDMTLKGAKETKTE